MSELYELKMSVEGLTKVLKDISAADAALNKLGSKTDGLDKFQASLTAATRDMTQAANLLSKEASRINASTAGMIQSLQTQGKAAEKALSGANKSAKQLIGLKFKDLDHSSFLNSISKIGKGYQATEADVRRLSKQLERFKAIQKDVVSDPAVASAFKEMFGDRALKYIQNNDYSRQTGILKAREQELAHARAMKEFTSGQLAQTIKQENAQVKLNQTYTDRLTKMRNMVKYQTGSVDSLNTQIGQLKAIEAQYQSILTKAGTERGVAYRVFNTTHGAGASTSAASAERQALLASATTAYNQKLAEANTKLLKTHNYSKKVHDVWRGIAASTGNLWLSWGNFAGMAAGLALGSSAFKSLTIGKDLGWQMELVGVAAETGRDNIEKMRQAVIDLGSNGSLYGPLELASALRVLAQAGLKTQEALAMLPTTMKLSLVAEVDTERSALFLAGLRSAFSLQDSQVAQAADQTAKAAAESQTSIEQMMESMKQASSEANKFGVSVSDTSTVLALLARVNITGSAAGTAMKNLLTDLAGRTDRSRKALEQLGISAYNSSGMVKPFSQIVGELQERFTGMSDAQKQNWMRSFLNERGMRAANVLLNTTNEEFERLRLNVQRSGENMGYTNTQAELLAKTTEGMFRSMKSSWQTAFAIVGTQTEGQFQSLLSSMTSLSKDSSLQTGMRLLTGTFVGAGQALVGLGGAALKAMPVLLTLGSAAGGMAVVGLTQMTYSALIAGKATGTLTKGLVAVRTAALALAANPWALLGGAIAAAAAVAYIAWDKSQQKIIDVKAEFASIADSAGAVSNEVYEAFNKSGTGWDIDKRLGLGVSIDRLNQLATDGKKISKEFALENAKTGQEFQANLTKIMAVTTQEAERASQRQKDLAGLTSTYELEQRVMVKDRTRSILMEQLEKFDQHHKDVDELSASSKEIRLNYEREINRVTQELMVERTNLALQQLRETAAEAIRQQGLVASAMSWLTESAENGRVRRRVTQAAETGDYTGLSETERIAAAKARTSGDLSFKNVSAILAGQGVGASTTTLKARFNSYTDAEANRVWGAEMLQNPQKALMLAEQSREDARLKYEQVQSSLASGHRKYSKTYQADAQKTLKELETIMQVESGRMEVIRNALKSQQTSELQRKFATVTNDEKNNPPTKAAREKTFTPRPYDGINQQNRAVEYAKREVELQENRIKLLEMRAAEEQNLTGFISQQTLAAKHEAEVKASELKLAQQREAFRKAQLQDEKALKEAQTAAANKQLSTKERQQAASDARALSGKSTRTYGTTVQGLRLKSREAIAGGKTHEGTFALAHMIQGMLGKSLTRFTAFNDTYHQSETYFRKKGSRSSGVHGTGRALDFTLSDPKLSAQTAQQIAEALSAYGFVRGKDFQIIDEYKKRSSGASGNHIDARFLTKAAADRFATLAKTGVAPATAGIPNINESASQQQKLLLQQQEIAHAELLRKHKEETAKNDLAATQAKYAEVMRNYEVEESQLEIRQTLGLMSTSEVERAKLDLQINRLKEESLRKQEELRAQGGGQGDWAANQEALDTEMKIRNLEAAFEASQMAKTDWETGIRGAYRNLVDDADNYGQFAANAFDSVTGTMISAMEQLAVTGKLSFRDMTVSILQDLAKIAMRMAMLKLIQSVGSAMSAGSGASAGGGAGAGAGGFDALFAKGGAFDTGGVLTAYASGGVVSSPTHFGHAGGRGLMGENGPEGILPLTRMPNGDLGVQMVGAGGGTVINSPVTVSVVVNSDGSSESEVTEGVMKQMGEAVKGTVMQIIQKELRFGGSIDSAIRGV